MFEGNREHKLGIYNKENKLILQTQEGYTILFSEGKITVPDKESKQLSGDFIFFTKDNIDKDCLVDLDNIKFEV